ncbi:MAG: hypothetical protein ACM3VZ_10305 [Acidobacteriota bacterium]
MTTPHPDIYTEHEAAMDDLESERISHGLTRGILFCHIDMVGKLAALQSEFAQVLIDTHQDLKGTV